MCVCVSPGALKLEFWKMHARARVFVVDLDVCTSVSKRVCVCVCVCLRACASVLCEIRSYR